MQIKYCLVDLFLHSDTVCHVPVPILVIKPDFSMTLTSSGCLVE